MQRKRVVNVFLALVLMVFMVQGCATMQENHNQIVAGGYKTLATAATTYETAFQALADLYKQGLLSKENKNKAIEYGNHFWTAYHAAVDLLASYAKTASAEDEARLNVAVIEVSKLLGVFLEYAGPYLAKK
jgi:hypothetical protein